MIHQCTSGDFERMYDIINDAARAYKGVIPDDRWHEPYMSRNELKEQIAQGVEFRGWMSDTGELEGVMGLQNVIDVTLIRHAYIKTACQGKGIGTRLLRALMEKAEYPVLVGTWAAAIWAVRFYEKNGFKLVAEQEKNRLLQTYWTIPYRQIETSVVLAHTAGEYK